MRISLLILILLNLAEASRILVIVGYTTKSHMNPFWPIIGTLKSRGHDIEVISSLINTKELPDVKQHELTANKEFIDKTFESLFEIIRDKGFFYLEAELIPKLATLFYNDPAVKKLLKEKPRFDVIITDSLFNDFILPTAYELKAPLVYITTAVLDTWTSYFLDVPTPFAYVPNGMTQHSTKMTFLQRLDNTIMSILAINGGMKSVALSQGPSSIALPNAPPIDELRRNVSLVLVNSDPVIDVPRPTLPTIVRIGPVHCRPAKALPKELEDYVESSGNDGFILLSLGSLLKGRRLPVQMKNALISAFAKIPQKVIWKFEESVNDLPDNVKTVNWMPQQDLLGHPKAKLFITHSGLLSIQEALYHGVPVLGIPVFGDQFQNIGRAKDLGFGESMDLYTSTAEEVSDLIQQMLTEKRYKESILKYSAILKDQPQQMLQKAAFWIEYVIRHEGAPHLRTPAKDLNLFQYFLLDAIAVIGSIALVSITVIICSVLLAYKIFCVGTRKQKRH